MEDIEELKKKDKKDNNSGATGNDSNASSRALQIIQRVKMYQDKARKDENSVYEKERQKNLEEDLKEANNIKDLQQRNEVIKFIEYEATYELMKFEKKELFNKKGKLIKKFNIDDKSSISLKKEDENKYFLEYMEEGKEPYAITENFKTKDEALESLFQSSQYEIMRDRTMFTLEKDNCIYLKDNKDKIRLNSFNLNNVKLDSTNINSARRKILLESLENNPKVRKNLIDKTLKHFNIEKNFDFKITENLNKAKETISGKLQNDNVNKAKTEIKNDSHAFLEGFLSFYGVELNKKLDETRQPFEVVNNRHGYSINKCNRKGESERVSPYFKKGEVTEKLDELNNYLQVEKKRKINRNLGLKR